MATIGTFFADGDGYTGIITTSLVQARMVIVPDRASGGYAALIGSRTVGFADVLADGTLAVQLDANVLPGPGQARLIARNGVHVLVV
ncbi:MAG: hypothetical protein IT566_10630 [Rhodospirillaceae bacterium]|nr:hypothetical protein [Rhodospirillaceae bacterium]